MQLGTTTYISRRLFETEFFLALYGTWRRCPEFPSSRRLQISVQVVIDFRLPGRSGQTPLFLIPFSATYSVSLRATTFFREGKSIHRTFIIRPFDLQVLSLGNSYAIALESHHFSFLHYIALRPRSSSFTATLATVATLFASATLGHIAMHSPILFY